MCLRAIDGDPSVPPVPRSGDRRETAAQLKKSQPRSVTTTLASLLSAFLCVLSGATAHDVDEDPAALARQARDILKANCYRCHGQGGSVEGGMNYVMDVKTLIGRKKIVPGDPGKSRLIQRVKSADDPMPPEEEKVRPSSREIATLEGWIRAGAPDPSVLVATREFLSDADALRKIDDDLQTLEERQQPFARYFTIAHMYNLGLSEDELETYRQALSKLVNSLSWAPDIAVPQAIDRARTVFRIDLRRFRWTADTWKQILDQYPYGVVYPTKLVRAVAAATDCEMPYVRADWFVFAAARPPLYHGILQLPKTDRELEQELKVDAAADIEQDRVARAGFNGSGVSRNNRLIERHRTAFGAYWKSYDFAGNAGRQNLFTHPLGPGTSERTFRHDGGEIIFNLPNGLQGYMLVDGQGRRIDEGPTKIVSVKNRPDPTVINGISCMFCHARGLIEKGDQIRQHVEKNLAAFSEEEARAVRALHPIEADFKALARNDLDRFRQAMLTAGAQPGQTEPVAALAARFESDLDMAAAASELGLRPAALLTGLDSSSSLGQALGALRVEGGTVQRAVFVRVFPEALEAFHLGTSLAALNRTIAETSESIRFNPKNAVAYFERGNAFFQKGAQERVIPDYTEAIRLGLRGSDVYHQRGMAHANQADYHLAIPDYDEAIGLDPHNSRAYHDRALAFGQKDDFERAIADLTHVLGLLRAQPVGSAVRTEPGVDGPQSGPYGSPADNLAVAAALSDRGFLFCKKGAYREALADFEAALRLQPRSASLHLRRGDLRFRLGADERALADYDQALQLQPQSAAAYQRRAAVYGRQRQYERSLADYREAIRLDSRSADAHEGLAWLQATCPEPPLRNGQEAIAHAIRAEQLGGKEVRFVNTLAAAYAESGQFAEAARFQEQALALAPDEQKAELDLRLKLYRVKKAYRLPVP
jgi:tetratricopeptide (TPR) repeat protein